MYKYLLHAPTPPIHLERIDGRQTDIGTCQTDLILQKETAASPAPAQPVTKLAKKTVKASCFDGQIYCWHWRWWRKADWLFWERALTNKLACLLCLLNKTYSTIFHHRSNISLYIDRLNYWNEKWWNMRIKSNQTCSNTTWIHWVHRSKVSACVRGRRWCILWLQKEVTSKDRENIKTFSILSSPKTSSNWRYLT